YVSAVGIDELSTQKKAIVVSPNPGSGIFKFEHLQVGEHLVIYDLSGKVVSKVVSEGTTTLVNMSAMPKGSYLYQTTYNGKPASEGVFVIGE
ncbi:MAG: T9SS type A sorting domain-containing protein, partial [Bacteroidota bacterium]